jgi:hypothetical protein
MAVNARIIIKQKTFRGNKYILHINKRVKEDMDAEGNRLERATHSVIMVEFTRLHESNHLKDKDVADHRQIYYYTLCYSSAAGG